MNSSGTRAWNRSLIELTNTSREVRHRRGTSSAAGCKVRPKPGPEVHGSPSTWYLPAPIAFSRRARVSERVAVVAAGGDTVATGGRIPGGLGPLDAAAVSHRRPPRRQRPPEPQHARLLRSGGGRWVA